MFLTPPVMCYTTPTQYYVDTFDKKAYNNVNTSYNTTDTYNGKVVTMDNSILSAFCSKLDDFYKYAPNEVLEAFRVEFIPELKEILAKGDKDELFELLDDWIDTVDIYSDPETVEKFNNIDTDIENGLYSEWKPNENIG